MAELRREEKETTINFNERDAIADVYSNNNTLSKQLERLKKKYPDLVKFKSDLGCGQKSYTVPKDWVKIVPDK